MDNHIPQYVANFLTFKYIVVFYKQVLVLLVS